MYAIIDTWRYSPNRTKGEIIYVSYDKTTG